MVRQARIAISEEVRGANLLLSIDGEAWKLSLVPSRHESANIVLRITGADSALPFSERAPE